MSAPHQPAGSRKTVMGLLSAYRWPIFLGAILTMSVVAQSILVYVATRPDAPRPMTSYYQRALEWDADQAVLAESARLGWTVRFEVPRGLRFTRGELRPVDVRVADAHGGPVTGLVGDLVVLRPAEPKLNNSGHLTELLAEPGSYRTLVRLDAPGLWQFGLDVHQGKLRFVAMERVTVGGAEGAP